MCVNLASSLLTVSLSKKVELEDYFSKESALSLVALVLNTAIRLAKAFQTGDLKKFDANPGEGGCQKRAIILRRLYFSDLKSEVDLLEKTALKIKSEMNKLYGNSKINPDFFCNYYKTCFANLNVSKGVEFLAHCYLLTITKQIRMHLTNGRILMMTDLSRLSVLSKNIGKIAPDLRKNIMENSQIRLAHLSISYIVEEAAQCVSISTENRRQLCKILSHPHFFTLHPEYKAKPFGSLFYEIKTLLLRLHEEKGFVALKSSSEEEKLPSYLFFQASEGDLEFSLCKRPVSLKELIVIFEGVRLVDEATISSRLKKEGFSETILSCAAREDPWEPTLLPEKKQDFESLWEINFMKEKNLGSYLILDHVYVNSLEHELLPEKRD